MPDMNFPFVHEADFLLTAQRRVAKADGGLLNGVQNLFTIEGGPVYARLCGVITTVTGGTACNGQLRHSTVTPGTTTNLSTAVSMASKAAGTSIRFVGATGALTLLAAGAAMIDPVLTDDTRFLLPIGTLIFNSTAANSGVIAWYLDYQPLAPEVVVSAI
jgi:hypothetical protein